MRTTPSLRLNIGAYLGTLGVGIVIGSLGPLLVPISYAFSLRIAHVGFPVVFHSMGLLAGSVTSFIGWGKHRTHLSLTLAASLLCSSSFALVLVRPNIAVVLVLLFLIGFGNGVLVTSLSSLFSEIYMQNRAKYMTLLHLFYSFGSFFGPLVVGMILSFSDLWYLFFLLVGLIALPQALIFRDKGLFTRTSSPRAEASANEKPPAAPLSSVVFWFLILAMFLQVGLEVSFSSWVPVFLTRVRSASPAMASYALSVFWLSVICGRVLFARLLSTANLPRVLLAGTASAAVCIGLSFLTGELVLTVLLLACSGLMISFVYPGLLALGGDVFSRKAGFVTGSMMATGISGGVLFPWVVGPLSEALGLARGVFLIPLISTGSVSILIYLCFSLAGKDHHKGL